ncbi:MAG: DUF885 family protein, partial [Sphingomonas sp.]|nr:DUF885 family protein [Sphingomonas sp.]
MRRSEIFLAASILGLASPVAAGPTEDFKALTDEYWAFTMRENPTFASQLGMREYDDRLSDISLAAEDRRTATAVGYLRRLAAIPDSGLSPADKINKAILKRSLTESVEANAFGQRMMLFSNRSGWHQEMAGLAEGLTFKTRRDYDNYLKRLAAYPALNEEAIRISTRAASEGFVLPCLSLNGFESTISGVIPADPTKSRLYQPFAADRPASVTAAEWTALQGRGRALIDGELRQAYAKHLAWYSGTYK